MIKKLFYKIKYFFGTIYRGIIGIYHNLFDKEEKVLENIEKEVIGKSTDGIDIICYKVTGSLGFTRDDFCKKVLVVGGIHGNEVGTVKLAKKIINYFFNKNFQPAAGQPMAENIQLFIIPVLNIDGYLKAKKNSDYSHRGKIGRFNANNVDLNRNFPAKNFEKYSEWGIGKNYSEKKIKIFCGEYGGSESEIRALINFIKNNNIKNLIMLHNVGKDTVLNKDDNIAEKWAGFYEKIGFKKRYDLDYSGSAAEWARENNIHYLTVEGSSRWGSDWKRQRKSLENVITSVAKDL